MNIKLEQLEMGYQMCTWGYDEPTHLRCSKSTMEEIERLLKSTLHWEDYVKIYGKKVYNNAELIEVKDMLHGEVHFFNINYPFSNKYQSWFDGREWYVGFNYHKQYDLRGDYAININS